MSHVEVFQRADSLYDWHLIAENEATHEDRPLNCPHPRCDFVGHNALSLAGHKRYRHREAV